MLLSNFVKQTKNFLTHHSRVLGVGFVCLCVGLATGGWGGYFWNSQKDQNVYKQIGSARMNNPKFHFANPLLGMSTPSALTFGELKSLKAELEKYITTKKQDGTITSASVYFRDMNRGRWIGINETQKYNPASMLKVVIMVAYYKQAETNPELLEKQIIYTEATNNSLSTIPFQTPSTLEIGKEYTVDQLIAHMIVDSDNGAKNVLLENISDSALNEAYSDLGENIPAPDELYTISTQDYSRFFRVLYNATYLNERFSEKALTLLHQTTFKDGLVAGVPEQVEVAHKFGEHVRSSASDNMQVELHDCGIVYAGDRPYALCIMTQGKDFTALAKVIESISRIVYQNKERQYAE